MNRIIKTPVNFVMKRFGYKMIPYDYANVPTIFSNVFKVVISDTGKKYYINQMINEISQVRNDYKFDDLKKTDIVLDVGSCIGGFCIEIADKVEKVFAVEPLWTRELLENIALNGIKNIEVIERGIGSQPTRINYGNKEKVVNMISFAQLMKTCGKIDFLKVDCEGGEWLLRPEDLDGVRAVEMEIHPFDLKGGRKTYNEMKELVEMVKECGFETQFRDDYNNMILLSGRRK